MRAPPHLPGDKDEVPPHEPKKDDEPRVPEPRDEGEARAGEAGIVGRSYNRGGDATEWQIRRLKGERRREDTSICRVGTL